MTTIRLSPEIEKKLEQLAKNEKKTKSEIIKKVLENYFTRYFNSKSPFELGKDLFGKYGRGKSNNSREYKKIIEE